MNILYCGDKHIEDGLIISVLSLTENVGEPLNVYVMTVELKNEQFNLEPVSDSVIDYLKRTVAERTGGSVKKFDVTDLFSRELPQANMETRFTPCCMLRLFADEIPEIPERVLYLDNDVVARMDISDFYYQDIDTYELAGVLDYYGRWFFRKNIFKMDYLNSGVLLLNMRKIHESGLFRKCREMCVCEKMFMPDQSAINKLANKKIIRDRRFNEQRKLHKNTVRQHFTTSFRFFPWFHSLTVKPWQIERVHEILKIFEYDNLFTQYRAALDIISADTLKQNNECETNA